MLAGRNGPLAGQGNGHGAAAGVGWFSAAAGRSPLTCAVRASKKNGQGDGSPCPLFFPAGCAHSPTLTPFQKATRPRMFSASGLGSG